MRDNLSWKCIWVKDGMGGNIDSYTPPFAPVKADDLIQVTISFFFLEHLILFPIFNTEFGIF